MPHRPTRLIFSAKANTKGRSSNDRAIAGKGREPPAAASGRHVGSAGYASMRGWSTRKNTRRKSITRGYRRFTKRLPDEDARMTGLTAATSRAKSGGEVDPHTELQDVVDRLFAGGQRITVLEAGCGSGKWVAWFEKHLLKK